MPSNLSFCVQVHIEDWCNRCSNWTATFSVRRRALPDLEHASRQEAILGVAAAEATFRNPLIYVLAVVLDTLVVGSLGAQSASPPLEPSPLLRQVAEEVVAKSILGHLDCASPVSFLDHLVLHCCYLVLLCTVEHLLISDRIFAAEGHRLLRPLCLVLARGSPLLALLFPLPLRLVLAGVSPLLVVLAEVSPLLVVLALVEGPV